LDFWTRLDRLIESHAVIIDRPAGSRHPRYPEIVYPFDYGYLKDTSGGDGGGIDVCRGSLAQGRLVGIICTVDSQKQDAEIKLLIDCTRAEISVVDRFFNRNQFMSGTILMRDSDRYPSIDKG
jgi:inorganic pyrophosphatase